MSHKKNINTILAQAGIKSDPATGALITPLHFSTTYQHPEFGQSTGFDYIRTKNPTRVNAEKTLAAIESAKHALVTSSGMSAIVLAFSIFPVGSKVLAVRDLYGGSFRWFNQMEQEGRFFFTYANSEAELVEGLKEEVELALLEIRREHLGKAENDRNYLFDYLTKEDARQLEKVRLGEMPGKTGER